MARRATPSGFTKEKSERCIAAVMETARKYGIPPVWITARIRKPIADVARREVMQIMIAEIGLLRWQVAAAFGRDVRSVRASVLGK